MPEVWRYWTGAVISSDRLGDAYPGALQRKVQQWRGNMANKLVYAARESAAPNPAGMPEMALAGATQSAGFSNILR